GDRLRAGPGVRAGDRSGRIALERAGVELECQERVGQLAVEVAAEVGRARAQRGAQPVALRVADVAEPSVLQRREDREHDEQDRRRRELPGKPPHASTVRETGAGIRRLTFLTKRLPRDNNPGARRSSYFSSPR